MFRLKDVKAVKLIGGSPELWLFSQTVMSKVGIGRDRKSRSRKVENRRRMRLDRSTLPEGKRTETKSRLSKFHIFAGPRTGDDETGIDIADERRFFVVFLSNDVKLFYVVLLVHNFDGGLSFNIPDGHQNGFTVHLRNRLLEKKRNKKCFELLVIYCSLQTKVTIFTFFNSWERSEKNHSSRKTNRELQNLHFLSQ